MIDREKVIKGLEFCLMTATEEELMSDVCSHDDCPYYREYRGGQCVNAVARDALALLKAQEPQGTQEAEWLLYKGMRGATCSYCKHTFNDVYDAENYDYYCRHCGAKMIRIRTVKWE